jgi:hypothetical protein
MIYIHSRHTPIDKLNKKYPSAEIRDLTSRGPEPWIQFSPFFPHGGIPVPFMPGTFAQSVEGIWQGLKVFESENVDAERFEITSMKNLKRTVRKYGRCLGHRNGLAGAELLPYIEARKSIFVPSYYWILEHKLQHLMQQLLAIAQQQDLVLLDYETNPDIDDPRKPLSHAALVRMKLEEMRVAS